MKDLLRQATMTLRGMWRFRWLGVAVAWGVGLVAAIGVMLIPDRYEASARIYVNTASILKPLMTGLTVQPNDDQRIAMLSRLVISRPNVEKLVQAAALDADVKSRLDHEKRVDEVTKLLNITSAGRDNLYTLSYRDPDPDRAKRVVQLFVSMFIESGQGGKVSDTDAAKRFIDEQIALYEKKLQEAENRLKEFKLKNLGMTPGEGKDHFARMYETQAQLTQAQLELREAVNSRDAFRRGLAAEDSASVAAGPALANTSLTEVDNRLEVQRRNLDILLQRYTDAHPDVRGTRRVIAELTEQRQRLAAARGPVRLQGAIGAQGVSATEQLKINLAAAEASVASLQTRVAEYASRYRALKAQASQMPQLEAELAQLNRDYDVNKKNYESLVTRRESASISSEMQSVSGVADFRLIDPPRVAPRPVAPNRQILLPLALLLALAAGIGAAFAANEAKPAFYDARSLAEATGLPVLGTVSTVMSALRRKAERRSLATFLAGAGTLLAAYAAAFAALLMLSLRGA